MTTTLDETTVPVSISHAFHNKTNLQETDRAFSQSFEPTHLTLPQLATHILSGKAWMPAYLSKPHRAKVNFQSAQLIAIDLDKNVSVQRALEDSCVRQHAWLVHPSPSSTPENPRTRAVFLLSEPVTEMEEYEGLLRGLIGHLAYLEPDPACKHAAAMFYGSDVTGAYQNLAARLPLEVIEGMGQPENLEKADNVERTKALRELPKKRKGKGGELSPQLVQEIERRLDVQGVAINDAGFTAKPIPCPIKNHEHDGERPRAYWHFGISILYCHKCGTHYLAKDVAEALGIDISKYRTGGYQPVEPFDSPSEGTDTSIIHINERYVSNANLKQYMSPGHALLIRSPTNTGKTQAVVNLILAQPEARVLFVTHRKSLARNTTNRLNQALSEAGLDFQFETYASLSGSQMRQVRRLVICINSVPKLFALSAPAPNYDLIVLDEIDQQLAHLVGNTFKGNEGVETHKAIRFLVQQASYVVGLDAYATQLSRDWLKELREEGHVTTLINDHHPHKGRLMMWDDLSAMLDQANSLIELGDGAVVFAVTSIKQAKLLYSYYSGDMLLSPEELDQITVEDHIGVSGFTLGRFFGARGLGQDAVVMVNGENSQTQPTQAFLNQINQRLKHLRVLIYTSAMGTGVDVTTPVVAVFGLFKNGILPADELHQMIGRCRQVDEYHVYLQEGGEKRETSAKRLFDREQKAAEQTARLFQRRSQATWDIGPDNVVRLEKNQELYLQLWSRVQAKINRSFNHLRRDFLHLAENEFDIFERPLPPEEEIQENLEAIRLAHLAIDKHLVLTTRPVDPETYRFLCDRGECTLHTIAGHLRWLIENGYRQSITSDIYDHAMDGGLRKLRTFLDLCRLQEEVIGFDYDQDVEGHVLPQRTHRTQRSELILKVLRLLWPQFTSFENLPLVSAKRIDNVISGLSEADRANLWYVFRWRNALSKKPINVVRRLLNEIGLKLEARRIVRESKYGLDRKTLKTMQGYARTYLENKREEVTE